MHALYVAYIIPSKSRDSVQAFRNSVNEIGFISIYWFNCKICSDPKMITLNSGIQFYQDLEQ
jgi:hypothetical protein